MVESAVEPRLGSVLEFLRTLWRVNHAMERRSWRMRRTLGVSAPQRMAVRLIGRCPDVDATTLAALMQVDRGSLSSLLGRVEGAGLVERATDPHDHRRVRLSLTVAGRALDSETEGTVEDAVRRALLRSTPAELAAARNVVERLAEELERNEPTTRASA